MLKALVDFFEGHIDGLGAVRAEIGELRVLVSSVVLNAGEAQQILDKLGTLAGKLDPLIPAAKDVHVGLSDQLASLGDSAAVSDVEAIEDGAGDDGTTAGDVKEPPDFPVPTNPDGTIEGTGTASGPGGYDPAKDPDVSGSVAPARETQTVGPGDVGTLSGAETLAAGGLPGTPPDTVQGSAPAAAPPQGDNANTGEGSGNQAGSGSGPDGAG